MLKLAVLAIDSFADAWSKAPICRVELAVLVSFAEASNSARTCNEDVAVLASIAPIGANRIEVPNADVPVPVSLAAADKGIAVCRLAVLTLSSLAWAARWISVDKDAWPMHVTVLTAASVVLADRDALAVLASVAFAPKIATPGM